MKTLQNFAKILSLMLVVSAIFVLASCNFGGALKMTAFTVDRSSVKTVYYIGEEIDFSGIRASVQYSDKTLNVEYTAKDLTVTYDPDITATAGTKSVTVSFMDPHLNVKQEAKVQITVKEDPNAIKHASYDVDFSAMKTTYFVGEAIDFTGVKIIEKFTNGGADVEITDLTDIAYNYAQDLTQTAGTKTITVTFSGESAGAITVTVKNPAITGVALDTSKVNLSYNVGDTVSFTGLTATITYENGTSATVTEFEYVTDLTTLTATVGDKLVTVKVTDAISGAARNETFTVKVDGITSYTVNTDGMTLEYLEGETVSFAGIVVTATYHYGKTEAVAFEDLTFDHAQNLTATPGNKTVEVKIGNLKIGEFIVKVGDIPTASANTAGVDLSYRVGETVDLTGLTVTLTFTDGTDPITVSLSDLTVRTEIETLTHTAGIKTVRVEYVYETYVLFATFNVTVYGIQSYTVDTTGMKTEYIAGDALDYTGIIVYANYGDGEAPAVVDLTKVSYLDSGITATHGQKSIPVLIDGASANVNVTVTVKKNDLTGKQLGGSYDTTYEVGEATDFAGMTLTLTYLNGTTVTLTANQLTITGADTATAGTKTVTVTFTDEVNNESGSVTFTIAIINKKPIVSQFENSSNLSAFNSDNQNAGKTEYGQPGFSGEFLKGGILYVIGDDNAFYLNPAFSTMDNLGNITSHNAFYSTVTVSIWKDGAYVALEARRAASANTYDYYDGNEKIVSVNTYEGEYLFYKTLEKVKISVLPDAEFYEVDTDEQPVVLEAKVIDAYNVYDAKELSLIHNTGDFQDAWENFRSANGLSMIDVDALAGIVLHTDIHIGKSDVPADLFYISDRDLVYYNKTANTNSNVPKGTAYLKDDVQIYRRVGVGDFVIEGNFFNLDVKNFPLVASPAVFGSAAGKDYGTDYSNSALFLFECSSSEYYEFSSAEGPDVTISNVSFVGNAARDNWVDENGGLVTAGGLILYKSARQASTTFNNCIKNSFFISYMSEYAAKLTVNDSKCYDSYQNAAFVFAHATLTINNSFINGTGGPVIIAQSDQYPQNSGTYYSPITNVNNTVTDTALTGEEVWFISTGATTLISGIKALSDGLQAYYQFPASMTKDNKLNIIAALMPNADSAEELADGMIEGTLLIDGKGIERWMTNSDWLTILMSSYFQAGKYCLSTTDSNGVTHTIVADASNGLDLYDLAGNRILPGSEAFAPFASANQIVLHYGGLSVVFELYH